MIMREPFQIAALTDIARVLQGTPTLKPFAASNAAQERRLLSWASKC